MKSVARVRVLVSGTVQGVFFRQKTAERARSLQVGGWIRNLPDGRVEAVFEGSADKVESLLHWCRRGPSLASVESVEEIEEDPQGEFGFSIF